MSHHFDTPTAREDPRINLCDFYLFSGGPASTVMAMTVNPDAGLSAPDTFREEGLYAFRFDLDGDAREELAFKVTFGPPVHADGDDHKHEQTFEVRRSPGAAASKGANGDLIAAGTTGAVARCKSGITVFAGLAPDLFAVDAAAFNAFRAALFNEDKFEPPTVFNRERFFAKRNVTAIVIELPNAMIGDGSVHAWASVSLHGHAPEVQVSRWGLPLITHLFIGDQQMREQYNRAVPADDLACFAGKIGRVVEKLSALAGSATEPGDHARKLIARLCPTVLPYVIGTPAAFDCGCFNGRALGDDVVDVILTLASNTELGDGVSPDKARIRTEFPYFGEPHTHAEQADVIPAPQHSENRRSEGGNSLHAGASLAFSSGAIAQTGLTPATLPKINTRLGDHR
jgi:hypothetical protein